MVIFEIIEFARRLLMNLLWKSSFGLFKHQFFPLLIITFKHQIKSFKSLVWNPCRLDLGDICKFEQIFWTVGNSFLCFVHPIFGFWFLVTFVYILQGQKTPGKKITQLKWPNCQKPKDKTLNSTGTILSSKTTTFSRDWLCSRSCCSSPLVVFSWNL